jgi:hypothetical protein
MQWEYLMSPFPRDVNEIKWLNEKGADGWELIQILAYGDWEGSPNPQFDYYFKRPIEINAKLRAVQTGEEKKDGGN